MANAPIKPWEDVSLQDTGNIIRNTSNFTPQLNGNLRSAPVLPPRPQQSSYKMNGISPYSGYGNSSYNYGGSLPYRNSLYNSYSGCNGYYNFGNYNSIGYGPQSYGGMLNFGPIDNAEDRFIQFAEQRSRSTFMNIENVVRAFSSISMMLDNTFFAMTSSFRAILSVAENFGRLRNVFGQVWYSVNIFRLVRWLYRKFMMLVGGSKMQSSRSIAWTEAIVETGADAAGSGGGSSWSTVAFLGAILSAPYLISKLLPKYEDKCNPEKWKSKAICAKAAFDFYASSPNEITLHINDEVLIAPKYIQDEMHLTNTGWAYAVCNGNTGVVPLNYLVVKKPMNSKIPETMLNVQGERRFPKSSISKTGTKHVSFGNAQFYDDSSKSLVTQPIDAQQCKINENNNAGLPNFVNLQPDSTECTFEPSVVSNVTEDAEVSKN